jgi:hypothetical protein
MAQDEFVCNDNQYSWSRNIEIKNDIKALQLSGAPSSYFNFPDVISFVLKDSYDAIWVALGDGRLYKDTVLV